MRGGTWDGVGDFVFYILFFLRVGFLGLVTGMLNGTLAEGKIFGKCVYLMKEGHTLYCGVDVIGLGQYIRALYLKHYILSRELVFPSFTSKIILLSCTRNSLIPEPRFC